MSAEPFRDRFRSDLDKATQPERALWAEVLFTLVMDALFGAPTEVGTPATRLNETKRAREYFTTPNPSLRLVCELIGLDPVAVRDRMILQIDEAPAPEELIHIKKRKVIATRAAGREKMQHYV